MFKKVVVKCRLYEFLHYFQPAFSSCMTLWTQIVLLYGYFRQFSLYSWQKIIFKIHGRYFHFVFKLELNLFCHISYARDFQYVSPIDYVWAEQETKVCIYETTTVQYYGNCICLTLWMLGNFLKIDYIVLCFLKPLNSACFLWGVIDWVANRLDLRPAAELLGGWPGSNLFA